MTTPGDREQARRWAAELDDNGVRAVGFVTGGGNDHLAEIVSWDPDKFIGFAHHNPFEPDAVAELERAVTELGLRGYKLLAPMIEQPIEDESICRSGKNAPRWISPCSSTSAFRAVPAAAPA